MEILEKIAGPIRVKVRSGMRAIAFTAYLLSGKRLTPNIITTIGVAGHIPVALLIADGQLFFAGILHIFFAAFDLLDGELARKLKIASTFGMMYDASTDRLKIAILFGGITQYLVNTGETTWVLVPFAASAVVTVVAYVKAKGEIGVKFKHKELTHHQVNHFFIEGIVPYDLLNLYIAVGLLIGRPLLMSWIVLGMGSMTLFWLIHKVNKAIGS